MIQRSTWSASLRSAAYPSLPSSTKRAAFHSLLAKPRPMTIFSSLKRTSWVLLMRSRPKRVASAPYSSIISSGSMPVPRLLLMRRPSAAWITEWM